MTSMPSSPGSTDAAPTSVPGLRTARCQACIGEIPLVTVEEAPGLLAELNPRWSLLPERRALVCTLKLETFVQAIAFINALAAIAEEEGHHPNLALTRETHLALELKTFIANGVTWNDFVLAAKLDEAFERV